MDKKALINHLDPRAGLWLLFIANIGMFCEKNTEQGSMLSGIFLLLLLMYGQYRAAAKGAVMLVVFRILLRYVFPWCPGWVNMVFPVFITVPAASSVRMSLSPSATPYLWATDNDAVTMLFPFLRMASMTEQS